jgi:hypothetical protein
MVVVGDNTFMFLRSSTSSNPHALTLNANANFPSPPLYYLPSTTSISRLLFHHKLER